MKIAITGTGIAGLSAAWLLNKAHDITVYEQNSYVGGHANTVEAAGHPAVDTGFIVYNEWTYPNLIALFAHLGVATAPTDMSFGFSKDGGRLEYAGDALFAQKRNLLRPAYIRMLADVMRFYKNAAAVLEDSSCHDLSLEDYLERQNYSRAFIDDHLLPMAAAIWSSDAAQVKQFPVRSFVQFFVNHGLLLLKDRPQWHTVTGGSRTYVQKLTAPFADKIHTNRGVTAVTRHADGVAVTDETGATEHFDHVIMAGHADQSLDVLQDADEAEKNVLAAFPYAENTAFLHQDGKFMPKRRKVWSSWNYMAQAENRVCVTYWMNRLQPFLPADHDLFVTLNPPQPPEADKTISKILYAHPQYTLEARRGWAQIKDIQCRRRTWFCGAWCCYGFHEDGISAGLAVAEALGGLQRPWNVAEKSPAGNNVTPA